MSNISQLGQSVNIKDDRLLLKFQSMYLIYIILLRTKPMVDTSFDNVNMLKETIYLKQNIDQEKIDKLIRINHELKVNY